MNEARAAASLNHPGIVPIFEVGSVGDKPYFTMAFIEGCSLSALLKTKGALPPARAAQIVQQVARAVAHAHHHSIVHRDLKPDNVLIDHQGNPRVTDFGLAKHLDSDANLTGTGEVLGTPSYMAPEQARGGTKSAGPPVDVYALGGLLYACLVGRAPFTGNTTIDVILKVTLEPPVAPRTVNPEIPPELDAVCMRCLAKEPGDRYPTAEALAADLGVWLDQAGAGGTGTMSGIRLAPAGSVGLPSSAGQATSVIAPSRTMPLPELPTPTLLPGLAAPSVVAAPAPRRRALGVLVAAAALVGLVLATGVWALLGGLRSDQGGGPPRSSEQEHGGVVPSGPAMPGNTGSEADAALDQPIRNDFGLKVELVGSEESPSGLRSLTDQQKPVFRITSERDAYVYIWNRDPKGVTTQLFPNDEEHDGRIFAGKPRTIPGPDRDNPFITTVSTGDERLYVIASNKPWDGPKGQHIGPFEVFESDTEKARWKEARRGIGLRPKQTQQEAPSVSEAILRYRIRKAP
jgi:hypothetical protein